MLAEGVRFSDITYLHTIGLNYKTKERYKHTNLYEMENSIRCGLTPKAEPSQNVRLCNWGLDLNPSMLPK